MKKLSLLILTLLLVYSCKKNQLGGKASIVGTVMHHTKAIPFARVFIKFNATEFPGKDTTLYDARLITDEKGKFSVSIYRGNYFLYGYGFDPGVPGRVTGGIAVKLRSHEELSQNVPVTED